MSDIGREARAKARAAWPIQRHALTDSPSLPDYARSDAPGRIVRGGR